MRYLYSFCIALYNLAIHIVSPFNPKAELIVKGRKNTFTTLENKIHDGDKAIWFHLASLGEFEQGRPLIEKYRKDYPEYKIILTFFSPSGYEVRKNYSEADCIVYLPSDSIRNAKRFMQLARPQMVFFVKYELWYNFIIEAKKYGAKLFEVSLILRPSQYFFKPYGKWFVDKLTRFDYFFVQNEQTKQLLNELKINNSQICGDTRFDRVKDIAKTVKEFKIVKDFCEDKSIVLMGSSWPKDELIMQQVVGNTQRHFKLIIAPHETEEKHIKQIQSLFPSCAFYTDLQNNSKLDPASFDILVINCVGILSSLYQYATVAYIGGGFGVGIHNILEAATFGKPIIFGTNYHKFQEANDLVKQRGAFSVSNQNDLCKVLDMLLNDDETYSIASAVCSQYVAKNAGVVDKIFSTINNL